MAGTDPRDFGPAMTGAVQNRSVDIRKSLPEQHPRLAVDTYLAFVVATRLCYRDRGPADGEGPVRRIHVRSGEGMMTNMILTLLSTDRIEQHTEAGHWRDRTIYMEVAEHARCAPYRFAVRDQLRRLTYRELFEAADRLAAEMGARGIRAGQRVAVWLPSRVETAVAMLACSRNGYVCCPSLHRDHTVLEVKTLLERTRASVLIAQPGYGADAERHDIFALAAELPFLTLTYRLAIGATFDTAAALSAAAPCRDPNRVI